MLVPEPMHLFILRVLQNYFREALGLDNPTKKKESDRPRSFLAYHYDFTPPPHLSNTAATGDKPLNDRDGHSAELLTIRDRQEEEDNCLEMLVWNHLPQNVNQLHTQRALFLKDDIVNDLNAFRDILRVHEILSSRAPTNHKETQKYQAQLSRLQWVSLFYVCNDLMVLPLLIREEPDISQRDLPKRHMAQILSKWRVHNIQEQEQYIWPFFTPTDAEPPSIPWASLPVCGPRTDNPDRAKTDCHDLSVSDREKLLRFLTTTMNHHSAYGIGNIHRKLRQPLPNSNSSGLDPLRSSLQEFTWKALAYVCVDLNCLPSGLVKIKKEHLIQQLLIWREQQPWEELEWVHVDSVDVLSRLHQAIREIVTPAWVTNPPNDIGLPKAGTLKADHWRTLFVIHLPLALLSLWSKDSPIAAENVDEVESVLDTSMWLSCALITMTKDTLTPTRRELFREAYL
ncbi:hypothetical protein VKT23_020010 [Stygiomarasmius scandens]|uniref:Uncharacterized protein n=1 Tax=Marasmiellus scandens TaxID=2682957 RepID=A0ABR1IK10_9AGAR